MCLNCINGSFWSRPIDAAGLSRRGLLRAGALGAALPLFAATVGRASETPASAVGDFAAAVEDLVARAHSSELAAHRVFAIDGRDLPWMDLGFAAHKGQQVTFLVTGRLWVARPFDLWFPAGLVFHARSRGRAPIHSPGLDTGTMTAMYDGPVEVARSAGEFADDSGRLWTPEAAYRGQEVRIDGVALVWNGDAIAGLESLLRHGDVGGLVAAEIARLKRGRRLPDGWQDRLGFGAGAESFERTAEGEIACDCTGRASIIERPLSAAFAARPKLSWRWRMDVLPSAVAEDQAPFHDYLSIGVKFEDGQDLTYLWSAALPAGKVFRCPLPGWSAIETHMVLETGTGAAGWRSFERDLAADYAEHIGGTARGISHVWLLAITPFQRRRGACRYADIRLVTTDGTDVRL